MGIQRRKNAGGKSRSPLLVITTMGKCLQETIPFFTRTLSACWYKASPYTQV